MVFVLLGTFLQLVVLATSYKMYQDRIPNGGRVPHPCLTNHIWKGVGHQNSKGGGARNPFGIDFANNGHKWNAALCNKDSDGDGLTNGQELGDPNCVWTAGATPSVIHGLSHPGVCEPLNSTICASVNTWHFCTKEEFNCSLINASDVKKITLKFTKSSVPAAETSYYCQVFDIPHDVAYHIVATKPELDNENVIHHMTLFSCGDDAMGHLDQYSGHPHKCGMQAQGICSGNLGGWTVGQVGRCQTNTAAGMKFGANTTRKALLQIHWNNPLKKTGYYDSSGITLYYTPKLRTYDIATLSLGNIGFRIPPSQQSFVVNSGCSSACTKKSLPSPVNMLDTLLHMHYLGVAGELKHYRNGELINTLASEPQFSYDNPITHVYSPVIQLLPGDELNMTCTFKSVGMDSATYYGDGTQEEMCFGFINYYPPSILDSCTNFGDHEFCTDNSPADETEVVDVDGCMMGATDITEQNKAFGELLEVCDDSGETCYEACYNHLNVNPHPCMTGGVKKFLEAFTEWRPLLRSCDSQLYDGAPIAVRAKAVCVNPNLQHVLLLILLLTSVPAFIAQ